MKIAVFFTYDYSIKSLKNAGLFERELKIYEKLKDKYGLDFIFFTYDEISSEDTKYDNFEFISIYNLTKKPKNKILRLIKSILLPFKLLKYTSDVDVIHQHQLLGSWVPLIIKLIQKKPVLIRTGYDAYLFSKLNNEKKYLIYFYKILTNFSLKYCDLYTVTSQADFDFLMKEFNFNSTKIKIVPNWIEKIEILNNSRFDDRILMVGRLENQKNYPMVFEFLKNTKLNIEIDVYGLGELHDELHETKMIRNLKINFLGNKKYNELQKEYKKYKYFLSTSIFEGNPKTILEAQNNGCIVIASNIKNHSELITHGKNGFLFESVNEIEEILNYCNENKEILDKFHKRNQSILLNNDIENISNEMYADYKVLVESK